MAAALPRPANLCTEASAVLMDRVPMATEEPRDSLRPHSLSETGVCFSAEDISQDHLEGQSH